MWPMSRWDEPTLEDEIAWLLRDLRVAENVRDALPLSSRDRALVDETVRSLSARLTELVSSSRQLHGESQMVIRRARRKERGSEAGSRANRQHPA